MAAWQRDGRTLVWVGPEGRIDASAVEALPVIRSSMAGRAFIDRVPIHVDVLASLIRTEFSDSDAAYQGGQRAGLCVPLLREGEAIGVIAVARHAPVPFTDHHVVLLDVHDTVATRRFGAGPTGCVGLGSRMIRDNRHGPTKHLNPWPCQRCCPTRRLP